MKLGSKYWIDFGDERILGKGAVQLLIKVDELGSLRKASLSMNMSYTQAWHLLAKLEDTLGYKVLDKRIGGKKGGSSTLTPQARELTERFLSMESDLKSNADRIYAKYFK